MAIKVPYDPVPNIAPAAVALPQRRTDVPAAAFGVESAQALSGLGKAVAGAGDEIFKRAIAMQELQNQTEAKEAEAEYVISSSKLHADYHSMQGRQAVDSFPKYQEDLRGLRKSYSDRMSNDASRRLFDSASLNTMSRTIFSGASHAATENKRWALGASTARVQSLRDQALSTPDDERGFRESLVKTKVEVGQQGALQGWAPEKVAQETSEATSVLWAKRIQGIAKNNPSSAKKMLDEALKNGDLRGEAIAPVTNYVNAQLNTVGSRVIAERIQTGSDLDYGAGNPGIERSKSGISFVERSGYSTRGAYNSKYGFPLGKYQVMESNLAPWLKEAGMPTMSSDQFLANAKAQEQLFEFKFGQYLTQYGNFNDAASMWFTGVPFGKAVEEGRRDINIGVKEYIARANRGLAGVTPLRDKIERGKAIALETAPDNPIMADYVEQRVISQQAQDNRMRNEEQFRLKQTIETALMGGDDGKLPTNLDELRSKGQGVEEAWSQLDPGTQRRYLAMMAKNAKGDTAWTPEKLREDQRLRGMAQGDPAEFLAQDVTAMDLPISARRSLMGLQNKLREKAEGDPQVLRAKRILAPMLGPANLLRRTDDNKESFDQFTGALQDAITDFVQENKRQPKEDELQKIGSRLLQDKSSGVWQSIFGGPKMFQVTVPDADKEQIKATIFNDLGIEPTDQQVQRVWTRMQYRKLYGSKATK